MHARYYRLLIGAAVLCAAGFYRQADDPASWSAAEWTSWRDGQIERILEPTFPYCGSKLLSNTDVAARADEAYQVIAREPQLFAPGSPLSSRMGNFVQFVTAQHWNHVHGLGHAMADEDYADYVSGNSALPPLLASDRFLRSLASPESYESAVAMIERQNAELPADRKWVVLPFESRFIQSPDHATYGRLLVFVPGKTDLWVNFAIATPGGVSSDAVSVVAVRRDATFALDYERVASAGAMRLVPRAKVKSDTNDNCYDCHKAAAMPIHPRQEFGFDGHGKLVPRAASGIAEALNARIRGYGPPLFIDGAGAGPGLAGSVSDEFVRSAAGVLLSESSVERVREAMHCGTCHDSFAPLNFPQPLWTSRDVTALRGKASLVQSYIEEGWMPPRNTLSAEERQALWRCLTKAYYDPATKRGALVEWLKGTSPS